eukprot:2629633-Amphidinium_carterae.2
MTIAPISSAQTAMQYFGQAPWEDHQGLWYFTLTLTNSVGNLSQNGYGTLRERVLMVWGLLGLHIIATHAQPFPCGRDLAIPSAALDTCVPLIRESGTC